MPPTSTSVRSASDLIWLLLGSSETIPSGLSAFIAYPFLPVDGLLDRTRENTHDPLGPRPRNMMIGGVSCKPFYRYGGKKFRARARRLLMRLWRIRHRLEV